MDINGFTHTDNIRLSDDRKHVVIVDQTKLPNRLEYFNIETPRQLFDAIYELKVRGAPAIGICAAYGIFCLAQQISAEKYDEFYEEFKRIRVYIESSRPTAVNLGWALKRMESVVIENREKPIGKILGLLEKECLAIHEEDMAMCKSIAEHGLSLIKDGDGVLTHCNAGPLATSCYGTALGPLFLGREKGMRFRVYADETRPLLQGARLTAYELDKAGIDVTLICDNMASIVMKNGWVNACFVGCDRVAANGDTANKIGTSGVAVIAKYYGIPFYVFGPTSSIDMNCQTGADIKIELREPGEIKEKFFKEPIAPESVKCYNPAFDITDNSLISGIVTEKGICRPPYTKSIAELFCNKREL
ncbi:MAG: Methylthioribose-1-phosphate isomerase [Firmicutes bacterium ADurb.Bin182]|nr:MAG: Methylthioribose-1-phosphate isomerase [Firmicutes bacterium ADurb.Bin182]